MGDQEQPEPSVVRWNPIVVGPLGKGEILLAQRVDVWEAWVYTAAGTIARAIDGCVRWVGIGVWGA